MSRTPCDKSDKMYPPSNAVSEAGTSYSVQFTPVLGQSQHHDPDLDVTTGASDESASFFRTFPHDYDIFREVSFDASRIPNPKVRALVSQLLESLQRVLLLNRSSIAESGSLPPLRLRHLEDESILVEWIFKDFRIGFVLEPPPEESSWYLITNQNLEEYSRGGSLVVSDLEPLLSVLLGFASMNA